MADEYLNALNDIDEVLQDVVIQNEKSVQNIDNLSTAIQEKEVTENTSEHMLDDISSNITQSIEQQTNILKQFTEDIISIRNDENDESTEINTSIPITTEDLQKIVESINAQTELTTLNNINNTKSITTDVNNTENLENITNRTNNINENTNILNDISTTVSNQTNIQNDQFDTFINTSNQLIENSQEIQQQSIENIENINTVNEKLASNVTTQQDNIQTFTNVTESTLNNIDESINNVNSDVQTINENIDASLNTISENTKTTESVINEISNNNENVENISKNITDEKITSIVNDNKTISNQIKENLKETSTIKETQIAPEVITPITVTSQEQPNNDIDVQPNNTLDNPKTSSNIVNTTKNVTTINQKNDTQKSDVEALLGDTVLLLAQLVQLQKIAISSNTINKLKDTPISNKLFN